MLYRNVIVSVYSNVIISVANCDDFILVSLYSSVYSLKFTACKSLRGSP